MYVNAKKCKSLFEVPLNAIHETSQLIVAVLKRSLTTLPLQLNLKLKFFYINICVFRKAFVRPVISSRGRLIRYKHCDFESGRHFDLIAPHFIEIGSWVQILSNKLRLCTCWLFLSLRLTFYCFAFNRQARLLELQSLRP
jgi:hypothetical protein